MPPVALRIAWPEAVKAGAAVALLSVLVWVHYEPIRKARATEFLDLRASWRLFSGQLSEQYPRLPPDTALIFENAPPEGWSLHFLIWLSYQDRSIQVFRSPDQLDQFDKVRKLAPEAHMFSFRAGRLEEIDPTRSLPQ